MRLVRLESRLVRVEADKQNKICKQINATKSHWKRMWLAEFGMSLILRIGPATVILSYLTQIEQVSLSLLNRHFYHVVQPSLVWCVYP